MKARAAPTRVVVCEDSRTYAEALRRTLEHGGELEVVGGFGTAEETIAAMPRLRPNLVTMDVELPGMSGLEAVEQLMNAHPLPIVVLSSHVGAATEVAAAALAAGALDAVSKEDLDLRDPAGVAAAAFRKRLSTLSRARVIRHPRARLSARRPHSASARTVAAIGICASTGGPRALATLLGSLPASYRIPILVVQHIGAGFTEGLAKWLGSAIPLPVTLATDGATLAPGVWIAPEGAHLVVRAGGRLELDRKTPAGRHRPSGDLLLVSLADTFGAEAAAVVLTGMGKDGAEGARAVGAAGGLVIAQDEATSAVYGMPKAAADAGAEVVLPLEQIARQLAALSPPGAKR
jgi:two-component system, chemotaxis family, protein-glutamate methylesterase/glutaminase